jgi:hypothetical protein
MLEKHLVSLYLRIWYFRVYNLVVFVENGNGSDVTKETEEGYFASSG